MKALTGLVLALLLGTTAKADFRAGDIYLVSNGLPGGPGVLKIDPATWQTTFIARLPQMGRASFDAYRAAIIVPYGSTLDMVSEDGVRTPLPSPGFLGAGHVAATGDGRVYMWDASTGEAVSGAIRYFDAANTLHFLMDQSGTSPFIIRENCGVMIYEPTTNSLFIASLVAGDFTHVTRVPLNAAGSMLSGPTQDVFIDGGIQEYPANFSLGPGGTVFLKIDDNSGEASARMQLIDPVSMTATVFARSQYFGVGGEVAGAYVPALGGALVLDSLSDVLRFFHPGETGGGTVLPAQGVSTGGSGENATLLVIGSGGAGTCIADVDDGSGTGTPDGGVTIDDLLYYINIFEQGVIRADVDDGSRSGTPDGGVTIDDLLYYLQRFEAGC